MAEDVDELPADLAETLKAMPDALERAREGHRQVGEGNVARSMSSAQPDKHRASA